MTTPKHIPTPEQLALDAQATARREKLEQEGHALEVEQRDSIVPVSAERVPCLAELLPEAVAVFAGLAERSKVFFEQMRPKVAAARQSIPCPEHPDAGRPIDFDLTCNRSRDAGEFVAAYGPCPRCAAAEADERRRHFWARRGMPERVINALFKTFDTSGDAAEQKQEAVNAVRAWYRRKGNFLLLVGTTGTGKGHLAAACLRNCGAGLWIEHVNMLADLRASYTLHTTNDLIVTWQEAEMFVLDEFGLSPGGKDEEPMLYQVLAERYDKRRPTIITSNLDREAFREALGYRLLDRVREDCTEVRMKWESWRTKHKGESK